MDLREAWKKLEQENLTRPVDRSRTGPYHSKHPVTNIINSFKLGLIFIVMFEIIFVALAFFVDQKIVQLGLVVISVIYLVLFFINLNVLRKLLLLNQPDQNVRESLNGIHSIVTKTLAFQRKISWGFFPICVCAGFVLGVSAKKDAAEMMMKPKFIIALLATIAIVTPSAYFLTRWMTKISYGKYLKQIEDLIAQMKEE